MIDTSIRQFLLTLPQITAAFSDRVYVERAMQQAPMPYVVVRQDTGRPEQHTSGQSGLHNASVDVFIVARSDSEAGMLADTVENALDTQTGTMGGNDVDSMLEFAKRRIPYSIAEGGQTGFPTVVLSFDVFYR